MPLVQKRRGLLNAGQAGPGQEGVTAGPTGPGGDVAEQPATKCSGGAITAVVGEEGQASLPLVLVPFEVAPEKEAQARRK